MPVQGIDFGKSLVEDTGNKINYLERKRHIIV
jgi:hypothetical protein